MSKIKSIFIYKNETVKNETKIKRLKRKDEFLIEIWKLLVKQSWSL